MVWSPMRKSLLGPTLGGGRGVVELAHAAVTSTDEMRLTLDFDLRQVIEKVRQRRYPFERLGCPVRGMTWSPC